MLTLTSCEVDTDMIVKLLKIVMTVNSNEKPDDSPERYDTTTALKRGDKKDTEKSDDDPENFDYDKYAEEYARYYVSMALSAVDYESEPDMSYPYPTERVYDTLTERQKQIYDEMLPKVLNFEYFAYDSENHGYDVMDDAFYVLGALYEDYPLTELYFSFNEVFDEDNIMTLALESYYFMPADPDMAQSDDMTALRHELNKYEAVCDYVAESIPDDVSTYEKYKFIAAYISEITSYDYTFMEGWMIGNSYGSLYAGKAICEGYARGFDYICRKADLWCELVNGSSFDGELHMWNKIKLDGEEYHVDVTWSDDGENIADDEGWLRYFAITEELILEDHIILEDFD